MEHPELPVFSLLAAVLVLVPIPWHWRARNVATLSIITWLFAVDVIFAVNSLTWAGNVKNIIPVWCDISSKIVVGASYALPLATLCICKHLETVSSPRNVSFDYTDRRRRMIFEIVMCFGFPAIFMILHYIVQGHRYDIFENIGCQAAVYISIQAVLIIWLPQLLFSVLTMAYAAAALHYLIRRRLIFPSHLQDSNSALTTNSYLRLIAMALTEMVWGTTLTSYNLYNNVSGGLRSWTTWADVHSNFSRIDQFPETSIPPEFRQTMMLFWWAMPVSSFIFFLFFGFSGEAKKAYIKVWQWHNTITIRKRLPEKKRAIGSNRFKNSNLKFSQLVGQRNDSTTRLPPISKPVFVLSPNPSIPTLPTGLEGGGSKLDTTGVGANKHSPDVTSVHTFSVYAQPCNLMPPYRPHKADLNSMTQASGQPPLLPEIPLSLPLSASPLPRPTPSSPNL